MDFSIKEIYLDNFKSFKDCRIKLDSFNVVVAPNNAGKSNLISAIEFIASTFKYGLYRTIDEFGGLETIKNYRSGEDEDITIGINLFIPTEINIFSVIGLISKDKLDIPQYKNLDIKLKFSFNKNSLKKFRLYINGKYRTVKLNLPLEDNKEKRYKSFYIDLNFNFNENIFKINTDVSQKSKDLVLRTFLFFRAINKSFFDKVDIYEILKIEFFIKLSFIRSHFFSSELIKKSASYESGEELNREGTNLASVLDHLKEKHPEVFENISSSLIGIVDELEGIDIERDTLGRSRLNFIERLRNNKYKYIPIDIISDGTVNLISTLTALYEPYPKKLIAIEEPERHLHLKAISYLMEEFREVSKNKQILITTQNSEILHNLDFKKDNLIFLFRDYDGNTKAITHKDIPNFKKKLKFYKNDIVELLKQEGLGYLGDYIGEKD